MLFHKVANMKDTPKFVPKLSFNPVKRDVWVIRHNLAAGIQSTLILESYLVFIFHWGYNQICKMFTHFHYFFTCLFNEIVHKNLALMGTFKDTVI